MLCSSLPCPYLTDFYLLYETFKADSYLDFMKIFVFEMVKWFQKVLLNCVLQCILGLSQLLVAFTYLYQ